LATGGATGMAVIALQRHVGRMAQNPAELRVAFSWLSIGPAISNFLGPVMAGLLIDYAGPHAGPTLPGFQWAFLLLAMLPLSTWFWVRAVPELHAPKAPAEAQTPTGHGFAGRAHDAPFAGGQLGVVVLLGCAHLCGSGVGP
jgi:MFS family permease